MLRYFDVVVFFADLIKVQNVIRGSFNKRLDIMVRQVDGSNMRDVLKECKSKKWTNLLVDLNVDTTGLFLKMVRLPIFFLCGQAAGSVCVCVCVSVFMHVGMCLYT